MEINWVGVYNRLWRLIDRRGDCYFSGPRFLDKVREVNFDLPSYGEFIDGRRAAVKSTSRKGYFRDVLMELDESSRQLTVNSILEDVEHCDPNLVAEIRVYMGGGSGIALKARNTFKLEPSLAEESYEEILRILSNMAQVMEQSPRAFLDMEEEGLRTHFLVHLNGAFPGQATGETFNFQGKTDILIRGDGRNVFIAECKFWKGEKIFLATIDQLLSYLSWRDTKAAVLVFNRNANFGAVLAKIAESAPQHPNFKRDLGRSGESVFRYVFVQPNDANREIMLTVLAFDVPTPPADIKTISVSEAAPKKATHA